MFASENKGPRSPPQWCMRRPRFALAVLYVWGRRDMADRFLTVVLLSVLLDYSALAIASSSRSAILRWRGQFAQSACPAQFALMSW